VGDVSIFDARSGARKERFATPNGKSAFGIAVSADAKTLALLCDVSTVFVVDAASGRRIHALRGLSTSGVCVEISPDGKWIAASDEVRTCLWAMTGGKKIWSADSRSWSLAFSPDSRLLLMGGSGTVSALEVG